MSRQSCRVLPQIAKRLGGLVAVAGLILGTAAPAAARVTLVDAGEPAAVIILPVEPATPEREAADALVEHIELMSGATLPVIDADAGPPDGLTPIRLGGAAAGGLEAMIREQGDDPWAFAIVVQNEAIDLRGLSPEGTRAAAHALLEELGVRWFMPGDTGRVVPERGTVALEPRRIVRVPSFQYRRPAEARDGHLNEQWNKRLGLGGVGQRPGSHGMPPWPTTTARNRAFEDNPEYFALIEGERRPRQICVSNPDVVRLATEAARAYFAEADDPDTATWQVGPYDGGGFCECDDCRALDAPDHLTTMFRTPAPSRTDRYVWLYETILENLADEFPNARIGFYAYGALLNPPHDPDYEPSGRLIIAMTPIHVCRIHGPGNPVCPESDSLRWLYEAWEPYVDEMWCQGYWFNLACPGYGFSLVHRMREEIPLSHEMNVVGLALGGGAAGAWASHNPSMYVGAKLQWDHRADVDAILADFYEKYYGPAQEPMAAYHTLMDAAIRDADHHTGSSWDIPHIYSDDVRSEARAHLDEAERLADAHGDPAHALRVEITGKAFDFVDTYARSQQKRMAHDFVGEWELMERLEQIRDSLLEDYEYPMLNPRHSRMFLNRFTTDYRFPDISGYSRVTGGNEMIVAFDHQWQFQQDPERWGHYIGLHRPESKGGNWQTIRTDTSWSNQGLRYYFGQAWYRQAIDVPETHDGRPVRIWFSGVDNTAEVWVNGQFVGANHDGAEFDLDAYGSAFRPFEFDVTDALKFGEANVVTVRTVRPRTNELGTGGLVGPVMLYTPADASASALGE